MSNNNLNSNNSDSYNYIVNTSSNLNQNSDNFFYVIDPNRNPDGSPKKNQTEDLVMYVSLKAQRRPITTTLNNPDNETNIGVEISTIQRPINFTNPNDNGILSTKWTNLFDQSAIKDYESFGIKDIKIKINASMLPEVDITFVDVRAKTLFEGGNDVNNPYNLFFNLPYPLFQLTVKGYYGKAIDLPLQLVKTNTRLDSSTGNYEVSCKFTSWTFGILNDLIMFYGFVTPFMYLNSDNKYEGQLKINQIFEKQRIEYDGDFPFDEKRFANTNYPNIYDLTTLDDSISQIGKKYNNITSVKNNKINDYEKINEYLNVLANDVNLLSTSSTDNFIKLIELYNDNLESIELEKQSIINEFLLNYNNFINTDNNVDINKCLRQINTLSQLTNERSNDLKEEVIDLYSDNLENQLGYKPTVENILRIVFNNMQAFIELLHEKARAAIKQIDDDEKNNEINFDEIQHYTNNVDDEQHLLPFPEFYKILNNRYEKIFPTANFNHWEEVKFINEIINAKNRFNTLIEVGSLDEFNVPNYLNITNNQYLNEILLDNEKINDYQNSNLTLIKRLLQNFYNIYNFNIDLKNVNSEFQSTKYFETLAQMEALNIFNIIQNSQLTEKKKLEKFLSLNELTNTTENFINEINKLKIDYSYENDVEPIIFGDVEDEDIENNLYSLKKLNILEKINNNTETKQTLFNIGKDNLDFDTIIDYNKNKILTAKTLSIADIYERTDEYNNQLYKQYN